METPFRLQKGSLRIHILSPPIAGYLACFRGSLLHAQLTSSSIERKKHLKSHHFQRETSRTKSLNHQRLHKASPITNNEALRAETDSHPHRPSPSKRIIATNLINPSPTPLSGTAPTQLPPCNSHELAMRILRSKKAKQETIPSPITHHPHLVQNHNPYRHRHRTPTTTTNAMRCNGYNHRMSLRLPTRRFSSYVDMPC